MASPSKEENVLDLIIESSPLKEWHFQEITETAKVTRAVANKWLKSYVSGGLLKHVKAKGRFPYFTVGSNNPVYYSFKRVYALSRLHKCGLIPKLMSLGNAKTIILFGSMAKGDYYKGSDIDIFIFGDISSFDKGRYEKELHRKIELHIFKSKAEIEDVRTGLMKNIINGYVIKGEVQDIAEVA